MQSACKARSFSLPVDLLNRIDELAVGEGRSRSMTVAVLVRRALEGLADDEPLVRRTPPRRAK